MRRALAMVLLMACGSPEDLSFERDVQPMLFTQCGACHLGADAEAGLDLVTNPYAAVVDVPSGQAPYLLVQPGGGMAPPGAQGIDVDGEEQLFMSPQGIGPVPLSREVSLSGKSPATNRKMNSYLIRHYQAAGMQGGKSFVTFVPIVVAGTGSDRSRGPDTGEAEPSAEQDESADRQ